MLNEKIKENDEFGMGRNKRENLIVERSFDFSLPIINLYKKLVRQHEYVISKQVLRSGTSIGANVQEAQAAQLGKDFIAKVSIASRVKKAWDLIKERMIIASNKIFLDTRNLFSIGKRILDVELWI